MMMRRTVVSALSTLLAAASLTLSAYAQQSSTAFTYQGFLRDNGQPANGVYDLRFALYDSPSGGNQIGRIVLVEDVTVADGLFTVEVDFGAAPFNTGARRWIEIGVRPGNSQGGHSLLTPRIELTPVPYAIYAQNVANNAVSANQLANDANSLSKVSGGKLSITPDGFLKNNSRHVYFYARSDEAVITATRNSEPGWYPVKLRLSSDVVANFGGGQYDEATGVYTVPTSGFYQISFLARGGNVCVYWSPTIELVKVNNNNERLAFATARRNAPPWWMPDNGSVTISGVYYLQQGDKICFRQEHLADTCNGTTAWDIYLTIYLLSAADAPSN